MDRNEILKRAQQKPFGGLDERERQQEERGGAIGLIAAVLLSIPLAYFGNRHGQLDGDMFTVIWAGISVQYFYSWFHTRQTSRLILGLFFLLEAAVDLVTYVYTVLGMTLPGWMIW